MPRNHLSCTAPDAVDARSPGRSAAVAQRDDTAARHGPGERRRAAHLELVDRHDLAPVLVRARQEEEQVLDRRDLLALQGLRRLRPTAAPRTPSCARQRSGTPGRAAARELARRLASLGSSRRRARAALALPRAVRLRRARGWIQDSPAAQLGAPSASVALAPGRRRSDRHRDPRCANSSGPVTGADGVAPSATLPTAARSTQLERDRLRLPARSARIAKAAAARACHGREVRDRRLRAPTRRIEAESLHRLCVTGPGRGDRRAPPSPGADQRPRRAASPRGPLLTASTSSPRRAGSPRCRGVATSA